MRPIRRIIKDRSISLIFIILIFVITLTTLLLLYTIVRNRVTEQYTNQIIDGNSTSAINASKFFDESIVSNTRIVFGIEATFHYATDFENESIDDFFSDILRDAEFLNSIDILNLDGDIIYTYPENELKLNLNRSSEEYFMELIEKEAEVFIWTAPYISNFEQDMIMTIAYRSEEFIVLGNVNLEFFDVLYDDIQDVSPDKKMMILDQYGIYIYDSESNLQESRQLFTSFEELKNSNVLEIHGVQSIISYNISEENGWYVVIYEDYDNALSESNIFFNIVLGFTIFILLLFVAAFFHSISIVTKHLSIIYNNLIEVTRGKFGHVISTNSYKEFNKIGTEFNNMSQSLYVSNKRLSEMAYIDKLTKLQSRNYAKEYFEEKVQENKDLMITFFYLDINRYHVINDSYGYDFGDDLLVQISDRLRNRLSDNFSIARIESDEFLLLYESTFKPDFENMVKDINDVFTLPFNLNKIEINIDVFIGIASFPSHARSFDDLITSCLIALGNAKRGLEVNYYVFRNSLIKDFERKLGIEISIDAAFINNEFYPVFQPIVDTYTHSIRGFEALSRWNHPTLENISPIEYIPLLEQSKKIHQLDKLIISEAIKTNKQLMKRYNKNYIISCNISVETIMRDDFVDYIKQTLKKYDYDPYYLELEITESTIIRDFNKIKRIMSELRSLGIRFSEDDFGEGFSSLTYLTQLELNTLKISKKFLRDITINVNSRLIISTIINLSKDLGFETVAEGIEDEDSLKIFKELDCNYIEGYYFYRPMTLQQLMEALDEKNKK